MSPEDVIAQTRRTTPTRLAKPMGYSIKNDLPPNPTVRLVFGGLMWFIFHGDDECQVGIHNTTQGLILPHRHPHELEIKIWRLTGSCTAQQDCGRPERIHIGNPKTITGIQIDVNNPTSTSEGVHVYQRDPFNRLDPSSDPNDWRWVIDFEKAPLYSTGINLKDETINPGVSINNGLFYTLQKTSSEFEFIPVGGSGSTPIGNVASYVGGNIYLQHQGDVTLTVQRAFPHASTQRTLKWASGMCYQIDITNHCIKGNEPCEFDPDHNTDRRKRNDFYLYYDTFERPPFQPEYALKRKRKVLPAPTPDFCTEDRDRKHMKSNNEAPCGPVGAGGGGGG